MTDFTLRPWREADAASIARYADNAKSAANLRDVFPCPYAPQDAATFVESCIRQEGRGQMCRAIEVDGEAAGSIGLFLGSDVYRRSAELGYWLGEPFWGRGIMTAAVETMCREGFAAWDIVRIHAEAFARNAASRRVLEKAGFALEGTLRRSVYKNGEMLDSCIYALVREEAPGQSVGWWGMWPWAAAPQCLFNPCAIPRPTMSAPLWSRSTRWRPPDARSSALPFRIRPRQRRWTGSRNRFLSP